jgi:hypothetical protein
VIIHPGKLDHSLASERYPTGAAQRASFSNHRRDPRASVPA